MEHGDNNDAHNSWSSWDNPKELRKYIRDRIKTDQTTVRLRSATILRRVLEN